MVDWNRLVMDRKFTGGRLWPELPGANNMGLCHDAPTIPAGATGSRGRLRYRSVHQNPRFRGPRRNRASLSEWKAKGLLKKNRRRSSSAVTIPESSRRMRFDPSQLITPPGTPVHLPFKEGPECYMISQLTIQAQASHLKRK